MCSCAAAVLSLTLSAGSIAHAQDLGPFTAFKTIPAEIDAAAVFENPAQNLLLSPVGRTMRSLLAMGGVFTQTERAWQALGKAFNAPVDDTIRSLLSKRVVVVWDGFERGEHDLQGLTNSIDTRWALVCEVEPDYLRTIRAAMRPVKRDIVHGRPVYAIEQGRYRVVMLENSKPDEMATVLLAPSNGSELLHSVLAHLVADQRHTRPNESMTNGHEDMLATLMHEYSNKHASAPTFAVMARTSTLLTALRPSSKPTIKDERAIDPVFAAIVKLDQHSLQCSFASDLTVNPTLRDAPTALLDAVGQDAVFALAASRAMRVSLTDNGFSIGMGLQTGRVPLDAEPEDAQAGEDIFDAPMLLTIVPLEPTTNTPGAERMGVCLTIENPKRDSGQTALLADESIEQAIGAYDARQAPQFAGRFPAVPRSISLQTRPHETIDPGQSPPEPGWLEHNPQIAWLTSTGAKHDLIIASIGPAHTDPTRRILDVQRAALTLDALDAQQPSGVLLRARMQPSKTLELMGETNLMDLVFAKLVRELGIDVRRGLRSGIRGSLELDFTIPATKPGLGAK